MNNWFTVKIRYTKQLENGTFKRVSEVYLIAAASFSDAEKRIYEEMESIIRVEFKVLAINIVYFADIWDTNTDTIWWKVKVSFIDIDEDNEKRKTQNFLVSEETAEKASQQAYDLLSSNYYQPEIKSVSQSPILDVFPFLEV